MFLIEMALWWSWWPPLFLGKPQVFMLVVAASMAARADQPEHPVASPRFDLGPHVFYHFGVGQPTKIRDAAIYKIPI